MGKLRGVMFLILFSSAFLATQAQAQTVLKMAFMAPPQDWGPTADRLNQLVSEYTKGRYQIKWFGGGQLGNFSQNYAGIKTGQIDMMMCDYGSLNLVKGGKDFNILTAPYLFRDQNHLRKFVRSPLFKEMIQKVEKDGGFKYLGYIKDRVPRELTTTNKRVLKVEDMRGLKIRVPEFKTTIETMKAWGAAPTPIPFPELYTSLKQGVVDGQENGWDGIVTAKFYEIQKYAMVIDYIRSGVIVLIAADHWTKMKPDDQKTFEKATSEAGMWADKQPGDTAEAYMAVAKKAGMEIVYPDLSGFKKLAGESNNRLEGDLWEKGLLEKIQAIK
jgi:tripartite ATP-independent transporter DctP family solute receptor